MRRAVVALAGLAASLAFVGASCNGGTVAAPPTQGAPFTIGYVAGEMVDAGCVRAGEEDAMAAELATGHAFWLACMVEGGTVLGCNAPCYRFEQTQHVPRAP